MSTNHDAHILAIPVGGQPQLISGNFASILTEAHTIIAGRFARAETIFDEWLIYSDGGMADGLPLNSLATFLVAAIQPGQYIAGDAFIVGQSTTDPFAETSVDEATVERVGSGYALLCRAQQLSRSRPSTPPTLDHGVIEVLEHPSGTDLHYVYQQQPLRDVFLANLTSD